MFKFVKSRFISSKKDHAHLRAETKSSSQSIILSFIMFAVAVFVFIHLNSLGWFASNNNVEANGMSVAMKDGPLFLGTIGYDEKYQDELHNILNIPQGRTWEIDGETYYITSGNTVSMQVTDDSNLNNDSNSSGIMPGSYGKLDFYLIVNSAGISEVNISLNEVVYANRGGSLEEIKPEEILKDADEYSEKIIGSDLQDLLRGHVLFFREFDDKDGYSQLINEWQFNVNSSDYGESSGFQIDKPYKITVYWIWPTVFDNYIYASVNQDGHLTNGYLFGYTEKTIEGESVPNLTRQKLLNDMDTKKNLFFTGFNPDKIGTYSFYDLTSGQFNYFSDWYNDADVLIGRYVNYLYLNFNAEVVDEGI